MFSLWRKARQENSAASRLLGSTSLRFALHGWQRESLRLSFARTVADNIICIAFELDTTPMLFHPNVKDIVQKQ
ncbi:hypothetical protein, partial [Thiolapillus sp.]|uniref:hypothetical protein n=1 Tax=Thiolapillus sp. TaxID=2017437 RepID=UPI003AF70854